MSAETANTPDETEEDKPDAFRYAVVDLASTPALRPIIATMNAPIAVTLFDRKSARPLLQVAPWLVRLSRAPAVADILENTRTDVPWGYYLYSTSEMTGLRQTLRRYNLAKLPGRKQEVLFRYWDPRVMSVFLKVMTKHQHTRFFEFIERINIPHSDMDVMASDPAGLGLSKAET